MITIAGTEIMLARGGHNDRGDGVCAMEAVAWLAGEPHSDRPRCVSPIIAAFVRRWNDDLPDDETRTRLLGPLLPGLIGTRATDDIEHRRAWLIPDWMIRVAAPAALDLIESTRPNAAALRALPEVTEATVDAALTVVRSARKSAAAAWAAAWAAAGYAAGDAVRAAAGYAAWDAARAAAGDAAWAAVRAAVRDAAGDAAWAAAGDAVLDAAWAAVGAAVGAAALRPTVAQSQQSACDLIVRLCALK